MLDEAVCQVFKVGTLGLCFGEPPFYTAPPCLMILDPGPYRGLQELLSTTAPCQPSVSLTAPSLSS